MKKKEFKKLQKKEREYLREMLQKNCIVIKTTSNNQPEEIRHEIIDGEIPPEVFQQNMENESTQSLTWDFEEKKKINRYLKEFRDLKDKVISLKADLKAVNQERQKLKAVVKKLKAEVKKQDEKLNKVIEMLAYNNYLCANTPIDFDLSLNKQYRIMKKQAEKKLRIAQKDAPIEGKWKEI